jgi:predicted HicB family RNase H-like nuclease
MNRMHYKNYWARVEFDADDGIMVGHIAGINDIIGFHSDTVAGLQAAFNEAVDDYLESCARLGKQPDKPYSGKLMLRVSAETHAKAALAASISGKSLNQWGEEALRREALRELKVG